MSLVLTMLHDTLSDLRRALSTLRCRLRGHLWVADGWERADAGAMSYPPGMTLRQWWDCRRCEGHRCTYGTSLNHMPRPQGKQRTDVSRHDVSCAT